MKTKIKGKYKKIILVLFIIMLTLLPATNVWAEPIFPFKLWFGMEPAESSGEVSSSIQLLLLITILALAPSIIIMMTAFTRIIIILSFMRNALEPNKCLQIKF